MLPLACWWAIICSREMAHGWSRASFPWSLAPIIGPRLGRRPNAGDVVVFKNPAADNATGLYQAPLIGLLPGVPHPSCGTAAHPERNAGPHRSASPISSSR